MSLPHLVRKTGRRAGLLLPLAAGWYAQAQVTIQCETAQPVSQWPCALTASHADGRERVWKWQILEDGQGHPGRFAEHSSAKDILFFAPLTLGGSRFITIQATSTGLRNPDPDAAPVPEETGQLILQVEPAALTVTCDRPDNAMQSMESCRLEATRSDGVVDGKWKWYVHDPCGGELTGLRTGPRNVYRAPILLRERTVTLVAEAEDGSFGCCPLLIRPLEFKGAMRTFMGASGGGGQSILDRVHPGWHLPAQTTFTEQEIPCGPDPGDADLEPMALQRVDDLGPGSLRGCWLVGNRAGVHVVDPAGKVRTLRLKGRLSRSGAVALAPGQMPAIACTAIAVRSKGCLTLSRRSILLALRYEQDGSSTYVCELGEDGEVTPLTFPGLAPKASEAVPCPAFDSITAMGVDDKGSIYVGGESGALQRIAPDGKVSLMKGVHILGEGESAKNVCPIRGLVVHPGTGEIYLTAGHAVKKVGLDGATTQVLGYWDGASHPNHPLKLKRTPEPAEHCLQSPMGLCLAGNVLLVADMGNHCIQAFNLTNRTLTVVAGKATVAETRNGSVPSFNPYDLSLACGTLKSPKCISVQAGMAMVGLRDRLVRLDLPEGAFAASPEGAERKEDKKE